ncbi:MAG: transcriptional regulator [Bdellovibrionales bacterium RIFOXYD1_FULL_55_31]|nr:MAG: transcriptional regulator [Bdellovibrionales bacterium RIFOXYD1_FULL_55_31]
MSVKKMKGSSEKLLTDVELELMNILWSIGEGSVADVLEHLSTGRDLAYTSVSTILRILEQKGVLKARKEGRGHIYIPVLKKTDYEAKAVKHVVEKVFEGTPVALVRQLLNSVQLDKGEIEELKKLLSKSEDKK